MEETKTYVFGQDGSLASMLYPLLSQRGIDPGVLALMNNGSFGGANGGGWFMWVIFLFFLMGWGGNGFGGFGNRGLDGTGFLANQLNNDSGRDLLLQAIQGNSNALSQLAGTLNTDITSIQGAICNLQSAMQNVGSQVGMSGLQVQNAIASGNAELSRQLSQCCCDNRLLTTQQGYESRIQTIEQTNQLGSQADRNTASITNAIENLRNQMSAEFCSVKERELQSKIDTLVASNATLRSQIDNAAQTAQIASMLAPIQSEVNAIKACQPQTVPVQWPNITAVNTTPYCGFGNGYGYGYGCGCNNGYWG